MAVPPSDRHGDVIVVGAGGAGCEAALRLAELGRAVLLISTSLDTVFAPATERVRVTTPDGTLMASLAPDLDVADDGTIGAWELHGAAKYRIEANPRIHLLQSSVDGLTVEGDRITGVETWEGVERTASAVLLCVGPFLHASVRIGDAEERAGRPGEMAYDELADDLLRLGVPLVPDEHGGGGRGRPAWTGRFERIGDDGLDGHRLRVLRGAYAAGICRLGSVAYDAAARDGRAAAETISNDLEALP